MGAVFYICLGFMFIFGVLAVMLRSMTRSAIALAASSVALGIMLYMFGAIWAAVFEISVCSGLVTVIFISAISLSNVDKDELEKTFEAKKRFAFLPTILIISGVLLICLAMASDFTLPAVNQAIHVVTDDFREILWNNRQADVWGQIVIVLTGTVAVVVLFKERDEL